MFNETEDDFVRKTWKHISRLLVCQRAFVQQLKTPEKVSLIFRNSALRWFTHVAPKCCFILVPETIAPNEVRRKNIFSKQTSDNGTYQYLFILCARGGRLDDKFNAREDRSVQ